MDQIVNALKLPFVQLNPKDRPSDNVLVAVWAGVGALAIYMLRR